MENLEQAAGVHQSVMGKIAARRDDRQSVRHLDSQSARAGHSVLHLRLTSPKHASRRSRPWSQTPTSATEQKSASRDRSFATHSVAVQTDLVGDDLEGVAKPAAHEPDDPPLKPSWDWDFHTQWSSRAFAILDANGDGIVERREICTNAFRQIMVELLHDHLPDSFDVDLLRQFVMRQGDADNNGCLSLCEFRHLTWRLKNIETDINLEADFVFTLFDADRDGRISPNEFTSLFKFLTRADSTTSSEAYIKQQMSELDHDGDGSITREEYRTWSAGFLGK